MVVGARATGICDANASEIKFGKRRSFTHKFPFLLLGADGARSEREKSFGGFRCLSLDAIELAQKFPSLEHVHFKV